MTSYEAYGRYNLPVRTAIAASAGLLLLPTACSMVEQGPSSIESTATTTTLPENTFVLETYAESTVEYKLPLPINPAALGYHLNELGKVPTDEYVQFESNEGELPEVYFPLAEVKMEDEEIVLHDNSPDGMSEEALQWFGDRLLSNDILIREALKSGNLERIVFAVDNDEYDKSSRPMDTGYVLGRYSDEDKALVFEISTHAYSIDADDFEGYVTHEVVHSLLANSPVSYFNNVQPTPEMAIKFRQACLEIRSHALNDMDGQMWQTANYLGKLSSTVDDAGFKARYEALQGTLEDGTWINYQPTSENPPISESDKIDECRLAGIGELAAMIGRQNHLPHPSEGYSFIDDVDALEPWEDAKESFISESRRSLYRVITEATYMPDKKDLGHPYDGLDELAASTANIMISYPELMSINLSVLSPEKRQAVLDFVRITVDELVRLHPDLRGYLAEAEAKLLNPRSNSAN